MQFGIGHPPTYTSIESTCVGEVQGSQIFKRNSIISIRSKVTAFLVILLSPWSPRCAHGSHVIPVIPTLSPNRHRHPHIIPIAPRRSPCGPHDLWSPLSPWSPPYVVPVVPKSSPWSPHHPRVVPVIPTSSPSSPHYPHSPQKVPMWSP